MFALHALPVAFINNILGMDGLVVLILGLLIFGSRLPEVGKNLGKTIVEFKKGLSGGYGTDDANAPDASARNMARDDSASRRLQSGSRVSVNENLETGSRPVARGNKSLPQNEEV